MQGGSVQGPPGTVQGPLGFGSVQGPLGTVQGPQLEASCCGARGGGDEVGKAKHEAWRQAKEATAGARKVVAAREQLIAQTALELQFLRSKPS